MADQKPEQAQRPQQAPTPPTPPTPEQKEEAQTEQLSAQALVPPAQQQSQSQSQGAPQKKSDGAQGGAKNHGAQQKDGAEQKKEPPQPKPPSKRAVKIGAIVVGAALLVFLLIGLLPKRSEKKKLTARAQKSAHNDSIPEVTVAKVTHGDSVSDLALPGTIEGMHETPIYARSTGYVRKWYADIGQPVRAGQVLAIIDAPDLDQELVQARAQAAQAQSVLEYAHADLVRWQVLYRDSVVTKQELDQKQATYNADVATYDAARAGVVRLKELVNFDRVVAPFTGVVTARNVDDGVLVSAGGSSNSANPASLGGATIPTPSSGQETSAGATSTSTSSGDAGSVNPSASQSVGSGAAGAGTSSVGGAGGALFRIARNDTVRLYVGVPQSYAQGVKPGMKATVRVREISGRTFTGRVARTAQAFDASTRTLLTEVDVVNPDGLLLPGMYAQTSLKFDRAAAPIMLPSAGLIVRTQGPQAAVLGADSVVHMKPLLIDRDLGAALEIDSGLADGDVVVMNASDELREGQHVRPRPEPSNGAAGGNSAGGRPANPPAAEDSSKGKKGKKDDKNKSDSASKKSKKNGGGADSAKGGGAEKPKKAPGPDSLKNGAGAGDSTPVRVQIPLGPPGHP
jgi:multidrug efflux pump subunit AcrA (membrane-fusion protein)